MARYHNGSALWLVMLCMTALISLCSVVSYRMGRSAEIARLIRERAHQYEHAEKQMHEAIRTCMHNWDLAGVSELHLTVTQQENNRAPLTLSCDLACSNSVWFIKNWRQTP